LICELIHQPQSLIASGNCSNLFCW
jgi:hypothetical protein